MSEPISKLRKTAAAATPGEWHSDHDGVHGEWSVLRYGGSPSDYATDICDPDSMTGADADYIARFDPPTVSAMLDVIEAAEGWLGDDDQTPGHAVGEKKNVRTALARFHDLFGSAE